MMSNSGKKDSIFIRFNGSDPMPMDKTILWSQRIKLFKRIKGFDFQDSSYPIQI